MFNICIIDADSIIFKISYSIKNDESWDLVKKMCDEYLLNIFNHCNSTHYLICLTAGQDFRKSKYSSYKSTRKKVEHPKYFDKIKDYLVTEYKAFFTYSKYEAEDLALIARNQYILKYPDGEHIIAFIDKDLRQYPGRMFNYNKNEFEDISDEQAKINFWSQMITGDNVDSIPGIPGAGPAACKKLFNDISIINLPLIVFNQYISHFGEHFGIEEFYKNYTLLRLIDQDNDIIVPEPNIIKYDAK